MKRPRCRRVTGSTRLGKYTILSPHEREDKVGEPLGDGRYEWLCGLYATWSVEGPGGTMTTCSRDLVSVARQLGGHVKLTPITWEGE